MASYADIKKGLMNLKLKVQKVQIKKYSGVASLSASKERKIAAEIQLVLKQIGKVILGSSSSERKKLVTVRESLMKMLEKDKIDFGMVYALPSKL